MKNFRNKITIVALIFLFSALIVLLIQLFEEEELDDSTTKTNREKLEPITFSRILFETDDYIVYKKIKRNEQVFTQGLFLDSQNTMIESGGLYGKSVLQKFIIDTPDKEIFKLPLDSKYFAEGASLINNTVYQLTWKERVM